MGRVSLLLISLMLAGARPAAAQPRGILLLRHGEESASSGVHLSPRGYRRAEALPERIWSLVAGQPVAAIYAQGAKDAESSLRSIETIAPTARRLGLEVDTRFKKGDFKALVRDLRQRAHEIRGRWVIVTWGHEELDNLARILTCDAAPGHGLKWPKSTYDRFWVVRYDALGRPTRFSDLAQRLLPGDASAAKDYGLPLRCD